MENSEEQSVVNENRTPEATVSSAETSVHRSSADNNVPLSSNSNSLVDENSVDINTSTDSPKTNDKKSNEPEITAEAENQEPNYSDSTLPLGKIPVEVSVEVGHFFVDASKKDSLDIGDVITLASHSPGQVRLVCNDHEVGRGELVDINGQLGVQIIRNWSA